MDKEICQKLIGLLYLKHVINHQGTSNRDIASTTKTFYKLNIKNDNVFRSTSSTQWPSVRTSSHTWRNFQNPPSCAFDYHHCLFPILFHEYTKDGKSRMRSITSLCNNHIAHLNNQLAYLLPKFLLYFFPNLCWSNTSLPVHSILQTSQYAGCTTLVLALFFFFAFYSVFHWHVVELQYLPTI